LLVASSNDNDTVGTELSLGWVGRYLSDFRGLGWVGLGWVALGWVGLRWVGLGWVGLTLLSVQYKQIVTQTLANSMT